MIRDIHAELNRAIRWVDGAPDITGLPCDVISSEEAGEYMRRYHLKYSKLTSIRFHHILASDPQRDLHNHPWDFISVILSGGYTEHTPDGSIRYDAPCVIRRPAEQFHRLELDGDAWTYVVTGRVKQRWGFQTDRGWIPHDQYAQAGTMAGCEPASGWLQQSRTW